jgi:hypothetical protein
MTVSELERAVATCPDTYQFEADRLVPGTTLMSLCRGLVTVEKESGIVRLIRELHYLPSSPCLYQPIIGRLHSEGDATKPSP